VTSLEQLPGVYREEPEAEDFTERFLSLFDAALEDLDRVIERLPALLDVDGVPEEALPWLAAFLGIVFDARWSGQTRRALLKKAPDLYRARGTPQGLIDSIETLFGVKPVVNEQAFQRRWAILRREGRLGQVRLFGRSQSRFRLGSSALGATQLNSFGNPDHDPVRMGSHQFEVLVPPLDRRDATLADQLNRLIESQKPAHAQHTFRMGGEGFILGYRSVIGIDTLLTSPRPVVLAGSRTQSEGVRLGEGILPPGPRKAVTTLRPGVASQIGIHTLLE
jgi:phage tail-like protein